MVDWAIILHCALGKVVHFHQAEMPDIYPEASLGELRTASQLKAMLASEKVHIHR